MKANLQILDAMLAVALQFTRSPDPAVGAAATDELQELAKRRSKLLKLAAAASAEAAEQEGAGSEAAMAA